MNTFVWHYVQDIVAKLKESRNQILSLGKKSRKYKRYDMDADINTYKVWYRYRIWQR